jgi:PAS domain S-box-containing protein
MPIRHLRVGPAGLPNPAALCDADGGLLFRNHAWTRRFDDVSHASLESFVGHSGQLLRAFIEEAGATRATVQAEGTIERDDGVREPVSLAITSLDGRHFAVQALGHGDAEPSLPPWSMVGDALDAISALLPGVFHIWYERANGERGYYYVSPNIADVHGVDAEDLVRDPALIGIHPDDVASWTETIERATCEGTDWEYEGRLLLPGGRYRWWKAAARPFLRTPEETVFAGFSIDVHDVHEMIDRQRSDIDQLSHINAQLTAAASASTVGVVIVDAGAQDMPIVFVNPAFESLTGYRAAEVLGRNCRFLSSERTDPATKKRLRKAIAARRPIAVEIENCRKDGTWFWNRLSLSPIPSPSGDSDLIVGVQEDVTARVLAERRAANQNKSLRLIASGADLATIVQSIVHGLSDAVRGERVEIVDCSAPWGDGSLPGVAARVLVEAVEGLSSPLILHVSADQPFASKIVSEHDVTKHGMPRTVWTEAAISPTRAVVGAVSVYPATAREPSSAERIALQEAADLLAIALDREQRDAELRQSQKMEAIGQLTGGVAHDFNNFLTVILGGVDAILAVPDLPQSVLAPLRLTEDAAERSAALVARLLAFARRKPIAAAPVDLVAAIRKDLVLLQRAAGPGIEITLDVRDVPEAWVRVDAAQFESALLNLVLNAHDAMPKGGSVVIRVRRVAGDPGFVRVAVADTGTGMSEAHRRRALEPFFTTKEAGSGTGLGLSMVHGFALQAGGDVAIESEMGQGTVVTLSLPLIRASEIPSAGRSAPGTDGPRRRHVVLVVEDEPSIRQRAVQLVSELGHEAVSAGDAASALMLVEARPDIDVVFTDVVLAGGTSGIDLINRLAEIRPSMSVICTSGYFSDSEGALSGTAEHVHFLPKPYRRADVARAIDAIVS